MTTFVVQWLLLVPLATPESNAVPPPLPGGSCTMGDGTCVEGSWPEEDPKTGAAMALEKGCKQARGKFSPRLCPRAPVFGVCAASNDEAVTSLRYFTLGNRLAPLAMLAKPLCETGWSDRRYVRVVAREKDAEAAAKALIQKPRWFCSFPNALQCIEPLAREKRDAYGGCVLDETTQPKPGSCPQTLRVDRGPEGVIKARRVGSCFQVGHVVHFYTAGEDISGDAQKSCDGVWSTE